MIDGYARALTTIAAVGAGLSSGFYFAFSTVVMNALGQLPAPEGVRAMQAMNKVAPVPWVIAGLGTGLVCGALAVTGLRHLDEPWAPYVIAGSGLYLTSVAMTFAYHVPRNNALTLLDPDTPGAADTWRRYRASWTAGNHLRTLTSLAGAITLTLALRAR